MELQLKNIGMIKEANVKIDGLTVIAGENDTGKSTVGKALYVLLKSIPYKDKVKNTMSAFGHVALSLIFNAEKFPEDASLKLTSNNKEYMYNSKFPILNLSYTYTGELTKDDLNVDEVIFIETPLIWNLFNLFNQIPKLESATKILVDYPYLLRDLHLKLSFKSANKGIDIKNKTISIMQGSFEKDEKDNIYFYKDDKKIDLINTATGIKTFGILQVLSQNNWLNKDTVLILDEPEVHLHPKWQLEMAKIIVELVKKGVKIVVNSHSPYIIEALKRYAEVADIYDKTNFYLAEDGYIKQLEDSNAVTLSKIFEKLSEPFEVFEEMDSDSLEKLING